MSSGSDLKDGHKRSESVSGPAAKWAAFVAELLDKSSDDESLATEPGRFGRCLESRTVAEMHREPRKSGEEGALMMRYRCGDC